MYCHTRELKQCGALLGHLRRRLLPLNMGGVEEEQLTILLIERLAKILTELAHTARKQVLGDPMPVPVAQAHETAVAGELLGLTDEGDFAKRLEQCEARMRARVYEGLKDNLAKAESPKRERQVRSVVWLSRPKISGRTSGRAESKFLEVMRDAFHHHLTRPEVIATLRATVEEQLEQDVAALALQGSPVRLEEPREGEEVEKFIRVRGSGNAPVDRQLYVFVYRLKLYWPWGKPRILPDLAEWRLNEVQLGEDELPDDLGPYTVCAVLADSQAEAKIEANWNRPGGARGERKLPRGAEIVDCITVIRVE